MVRQSAPWISNIFETNDLLFSCLVRADRTGARCPRYTQCGPLDTGIGEIRLYVEKKPELIKKNFQRSINDGPTLLFRKNQRPPLRHSAHTCELITRSHTLFPAHILPYGHRIGMYT